MRRRISFRPRDPDRRSLQKAARTALVMTAVFLFGRYVLDNSQFAVIATFTSAALLGIADFSGSRPERLRANLATLAAGAVLLAIGTAVSTNTAAATISMLVVTLIVGFSAVFSGYFAAASNAVIVFYVVATGITAPPSTIPAREAGLAVGGALSVLAAGWLWPSRVVAESRRALAEVYRQLAAAVGGLSTRRADEAGVLDADGLGTAILQAEEAIARSAWRPDGLARPHKARMYMLQGARRASEIIGALSALPHDREGPLHGDAVRFEAVLARSLDACATGLIDGPLPEPDPVERENAAFAAAARAGFAERATTGSGPRALQDVAAETFLLDQLGWGVVLAVHHCRAMFNAPTGSAGEADRTSLLSTLSDGPSLGKWARRARRNLSPRSVHFQNSVRLAAGLALARLAVGVFHLEHGFWVGFATLVVLKTSAAGTRATAVQAAIGTAIGFGVSTALIAAFGVNDAVYAVVLPLVIFAAFYLPGAVSFVAGQACFTMVIVILFNLIQPAGWSVGLFRLEDVLIGAGIGLLIGMAIWPGGASSELRGVVATLFVAASTFARATVAGIVGAGPLSGTGDERPGDDLALRVHIAANDAEDVFSQYLSELHQSDAPVMAWASVIASAHRLWFGAEVASLVPPLAPGCPPSPSPTDAVLESTRVVDENYRRVAASLTDGSPLLLDPIPRLVVPGDLVPVDETLTLMEVGTWLDELGGGLEVVRATLVELRLPAATGPAARKSTAVAPV